MVFSLAASIVAASAGLAFADPGATPIAPSPDCGLEDPAIARAAEPIGPKRSEMLRKGASPSSEPVVRSSALSIGTASRGSLVGKTVYLSPGHGFTHLPQVSGWRTQRGNSHELVEDFISVETASTYLVRYLRNMGATVITTRETDFSPNAVIVDDGDADFGIGAGVSVLEEGLGYGPIAGAITGNENPFDTGGHKLINATAESDSEVSWIFDVAVAGSYNVYVGYVAEPSRAADAHYVVRHQGGETHFRVDQRRHGQTWVFLGRFYFPAGRDAIRGAVALVTDSETPGATLSADVVRIGGGMGVFDRGDGVLERPMFEHAARYYTQWAGAPPSVYDYGNVDRNNDVGCRPRFAAWDHEEGEDAVYVAWHTNAPSPARGTSSYAYAPVDSGTVDDFTGVPGSLELMDAIHNQLVGDIRAEWDSGWQDRGQRTAFFGEVNPNHNPEMPATLLEVAFHSTAEDADSLRDPRFRSIAARAIARGVATYFALRDGVDVVLPPSPPTALVMENHPESQGLRLSWQPSIGGADEYVVYLSSDGRGFADGIVTSETELIVPAGDGGAPVFARVAGLNSGGESLPSRLVGAKRSINDSASVLVVAGFDRLDGSMLSADNLEAYDLGSIDRGMIERINDLSHAARYGAAIAQYGASFATADAEAVARNDVRLADYVAVVWFTGENSGRDSVLSPAARTLVSDYLGGGGQLMMSGTELAWTLDNILADEFSGYFQGTFGAGYIADDAGTYDLVGGDGPFLGLPAMSFDDSGEGGYDANFPDVIDAVVGGPILRYQGVDEGAAAIYADELSVFFLGFPFETISGAGNRADVMARVLAEFDIDEEVEPEGPGGPNPGDLDGGCGCGVGQAGARSSSQGWAQWLALLALLLATFRRSWTIKRPTP